MSKNLSKQLCELCGIKQTVDFTKPENFVRLLKIANDTLGGVNFATAYTKNQPNIFKEQALMHYLLIAKVNNVFQTAIKEAQWLYD